MSPAAAAIAAATAAVSCATVTGGAIAQPERLEPRRDRLGALGDQALLQPGVRVRIRLAVPGRKRCTRERAGAAPRPPRGTAAPATP